MPGRRSGGKRPNESCPLRWRRRRRSTPCRPAAHSIRRLPVEEGTATTTLPRVFPGTTTTVHRMKRTKMSASNGCQAICCGAQATSSPAPQRTSKELERVGLIIVAPLWQECQLDRLNPELTFHSGCARQSGMGKDVALAGQTGVGFRRGRIVLRIRRRRVSSGLPSGACRKAPIRRTIAGHLWIGRDGVGSGP